MLLPKTERMDLSMMFASKLSIVFVYPITNYKNEIISIETDNYFNNY